MLGRKSKEEVAPEPPAFPYLLGYVWGWFEEILDGLAANGFAPPMVTWADIGWWSELTGNALEPWEARLLVKLGSVRAIAVSEKTKKPAPNTSPPTKQR
jgi:hypothetical protein